MSLEKLSEILHRCYQCKYCTFTGHPLFYENCPSLVEYKFEIYSAPGRMSIAKGIFNGELKWTDHIIHVLYSCTTCGNCTTQCIYPISQYITEIIEALREKAVKDGVGPLPRHKQFGEHVLKEHNPYFEKHEDRLKWLPKDVELSDKPDIVYFVGCTSSYRQTEIAIATVRILSALGVKFTILPDEWCCGSPLLRTGQTDIVRDLAKHNVKLIHSLGVKEIVTSCAGCYRTFRIDYPRKLRVYPRFRILHITEFLEREIKKGRLKFENKLDLKVTYHDPCHLARHAKIFDPPRTVLKSLGVELIEMKRTRENAFCCGAGGGVKSGYPDFALKTAYRRLEDALKTNASVLVSSCPFCKRNLKDASEHYGVQLEVLDITELVAKALE
ncbi:MAG: (Fe-S)-binding protein [Candidatus Baldrarchaeia archaeon]